MSRRIAEQICREFFFDQYRGIRFGPVRFCRSHHADCCFAFLVSLDNFAIVCIGAGGVRSASGDGDAIAIRAELTGAGRVSLGHFDLSILSSAVATNG